MTNSQSALAVLFVLDVSRLDLGGGIWYNKYRKTVG